MNKFFIFLFFISIILFSFYSYSFIVTHIIPLNKNFILNVQPNDNLNKIVKILKANGLKGNTFLIKLYTRIFFKNLVIKVGSYEIDQFSTYWSILQDINKGVGITIKIIIPPGLKILEIAELFQKNKIIPKEQFYNIIGDLDFLMNYSLLQKPEILAYWQNFKINIHDKKLEGFFYPETYIFSKGVSYKIILSEPIEYFFKILEKFPISQLTFLEIYKKIIIASLIEEEAILDFEKPIIASVIYNRLAKNMRLELCPTVEYILPKHKKNLTVEDLNIKSPYNTYLNLGLPPTPICNPSFESLKAAFYPANTEYLFYVSKGDGSHFFSKTYSEHLQYKNKSGFYK